MALSIEQLLTLAVAVFSAYTKISSARRGDLRLLRQRVAKLEAYIEADGSAVALFLDSLDLLIDDLSTEARKPFRALVSAFRIEWRSRKAKLEGHDDDNEEAAS